MAAVGLVPSTGTLGEPWGPAKGPQDPTHRDPVDRCVAGGC